MTETQAKSGAVGASTDAPDTPEATTDTTTSGESDATAGRSEESPTNVIRSGTSSAGAQPSSDTSSGTATGGTASPLGTPLTFSPAKLAPTSPSGPTPPSVTASGSAAASSGTSPGPAPKVADSEPTIRTSVPVVGVPAAGAPTSSSPSTGPTITRPASVASGSTGRTSSAGIATPSPTPVGRAPVVATSSLKTGVRPAPGDRAAVGAPGRSAAGTAAVGAARVSDTLRSARATVAGAATRGPRRARLHLKRIDPWSVMKFSFAVSLVLFVVAIVATSVLYLALDAMSVFDSVNRAFAEVTGQSGAEAAGFKITAKGVIGTSVLLGAVNMVLFTALATLGAFVYNVCADLVGGVELTLSEKE
jgi:Transmembrane domain of unknown function (DUF3566)